MYRWVVMGNEMLNYYRSKAFITFFSLLFLSSSTRLHYNVLVIVRFANCWFCQQQLFDNSWKVSIISCNSKDQLGVSPFQNVLSISGVLESSWNLNLSFNFFFCLKFFGKHIFYSFFGKACMCVNLEGECIAAKLLFFMVGKISIQLAFTLSKTGLLTRSLLVRLKRSAKTAPSDVF